MTSRSSGGDSSSSSSGQEEKGDRSPLSLLLLSPNDEVAQIGSVRRDAYGGTERLIGREEGR